MKKIVKRSAALFLAVLMGASALICTAAASAEIQPEQAETAIDTGVGEGSGEMPEETAASAGRDETEESAAAEEPSEEPVSDASEGPEPEADAAPNIPALQTTLHNAYISGVTGTTFQPDSCLTRAQAAQLLYNLLTDTAHGTITCEFSDVTSGRWYYTPVTVLASYGVLNGYADGTFRPDNSITRAEFIKIISSVTGLSAGTDGACSFTDVPASHWARGYIIAASAQGWIGGYADGTFHPDSYITRAEAVTVLNRVLNRGKDAAAVALAADALKFTDVQPGSWYYYAVMEAAITHTYTRDDYGETWQEYSQSSGTHTGWLQLNGTWYYFDSNGKKTVGWLKDNGTWYYLDHSGAMSTGLITIDGNTFYLADNGAMQTGWVYTDGNWYYFDGGGYMMHSQWLKLSGSWYYLLDSGAMAASQTVMIDGTEYSFNANGTWIDSLQLSVEATAAAKITTQLVVVIDHRLTFWQQDSQGRFVKELDTYCGYGSNGLLLGTKRVQGSNTTPIGCYPLTLAFGTGSNPGTNMTYRQITSYSYWSGENNSRYNTWVESKTAITGEHLIDYYQYKYAIAIGFNMNPTVYGRGSAIFLHCKSTDHWSTGGCVSITESEMLWLMKQLNNGAYIIIVPDQATLSSY